MESHSRAHHEKELITEEGIKIFSTCASKMMSRLSASFVMSVSLYFPAANVHPYRNFQED